MFGCPHQVILRAYVLGNLFIRKMSQVKFGLFNLSHSMIIWNRFYFLNISIILLSFIIRTKHYLFFNISIILSSSLCLFVSLLVLFHVFHIALVIPNFLYMCYVHLCDHSIIIYTFCSVPTSEWNFSAHFSLKDYKK